MSQEQFIYSQKNNFTGGELTPTIEGRTELTLYHNGVKKMINQVVLPSGGIMRRHGTRFVHLFADNVPKKIINVMFSRKLSYLLVFEAHPLKTVCTFFAYGELFVTSKVIKDNGNSGNDFHFRPKDFSSCCYQGAAYICFGSNRPIFKFSVDPAILEKFADYLKAQETAQQQQGQAQNIQGSEINSIRDTEAATNFPDKDRLFIIQPLKCNVNYFKVAQNNNQERSFNEIIHNFQPEQINDGLRNIHNNAATNIFEKKEEHLYASSVVAFASRLWSFGVNKNIHGIWASYKGDFNDFRMAYKSLIEARNPLSAFSSTFSSSSFDAVLWTIPFASELLLGTTDGLYIVKEGDRTKGEFIHIHKELDVPIAPIKPVIMGKTIFFVEGNNGKINSLFYSQEKGGFQISDITAYAECIFAGGIRQIAGISTPFQMLVAVLKDGSFAIFTYSDNLKIMGWSRHFLGGNAEVLSVTPLYADNEDRLYFNVRRSEEHGTGYKEYLEVLSAKYFSAKIFTISPPVYVDCYVEMQSQKQSAVLHSLVNSLEQAIKDESGFEFRGGITKLEQIVHDTIRSSLQLDSSNITTDNFKYKNKPVAEYQQAQEIIIFLKKYYKDYLPVIMESIGVIAGLFRIFTQIIIEFENLFCGYNESMTKIEQLLYDGERLGGDLIKLISGEDIGNILGMGGGGNGGIQNWDIPQIVRDNGLMQYLPESSFSFYPIICLKLKAFNTDLIRLIVALSKEILSSVKEVTAIKREVQNELQELRSTVAILNKRLLLYYADYDFANKQPLIVNLKKFFQQNAIDFYPELLNITHPFLTKYLHSSKAREVVNNRIVNLSTNSTNEQLQTCTQNAVKELVKELDHILQQTRFDETGSLKRREEITELLRELLLGRPVNAANKKYILSDKFLDDLNFIIDEQIEAIQDAGGMNEAAGQAEIRSEAGSEEDEQDSPAAVIEQKLEDIKEGLTYLQQLIPELSSLVMVSSSAYSLKTLLSDRNNIRLDKYLLLSKKYFPVFRRIFPELSLNDLGAISLNCLPAFNQVNITQILPIFKAMNVAVIGDEELEATIILSDNIIKLKKPARNVQIGFSYRSVLQTFPFIFPEEVEHMPKHAVTIGVKFFNSRGGYMQEKTETRQVVNQHIESNYIDSNNIIKLTNERQYVLTKEVCNILASPYLNGWVSFNSQSFIKTDIDFTFIVDKPCPATILKIYAKAKILPDLNL